MKNKIYYLSTCSTCQRIIKGLNDGVGFVLQDIKTDAITPAQLEEMCKKTGSYQVLFSRRALKFKAMALHEKELSEADYRDLILGEYTFLARPVIFIDGEIYVGNDKRAVEAAQEALGL